MSTNLDSRLASYSSPLLSVFRIVFGLLFTVYGSSKIFGWPMAGQVPVGSWPAWWAGLIELVAGLLITVGFFTRIAAFIASGEMAVAYLWKHWPIPEGASFWPMENQGEVPLMFCFGFLAIAGLGAGAWSVDARRRVGGGSGVRRGRVVTGTAAPAGTPAAAPVRRGWLLSRFRRNRY